MSGKKKELFRPRPAVWVAVAGVVGLGAAVAAYAGSPPFGDPKSVKYADALWKKMEQADFVGDGVIKTVPYEGQHPHGAVLETLYGKVSVKGHTGEQIVKRNYGGEGITNAKVAKNRKEYLSAVTVMFKRGPGKQQLVLGQVQAGREPSHQSQGHEARRPGRQGGGQGLHRLPLQPEGQRLPVQHCRVHQQVGCRSPDTTGG